jgi:hypothetical protein
MPALVEIRLFDQAMWTDDGYNTWLDDDYNVWYDTYLSIRLSNESYAGDRYWDQKIISFSAPQYRLNHLSGGYCKIGFGDLTVTLDTFDEMQKWPPPEKCTMVIYYADDSGNITEILSGTLHLKTLSRDGITYQMYEKTLDAMLLTNETDYNGDSVAMPRAFGAVQYQKAVRLPDAVGNQVYHHGYMNGTVGTDWHVFDDGVNIDVNVTAATDSTFQLSVLPVGEVTVSGTGVASTLAEVIQWACGITRLNIAYDCSLSSPATVSCWETSQDTIVSFLDKLTSYFGQLFYITSTVLYLVDMDADNGTTIDITESDFLPSSITWAAPVSLVSTEWSERTAVEESIGKYVKDTNQNAAYTGEHPYGASENVLAYQSSRADIEVSLSKIYRLMTSDRWETSIPLDAVYPLPGQKITAIDNSMGKQVSIAIHARDIEYDFENRLVRISGEGLIQ